MPEDAEMTCPQCQSAMATRYGPKTQPLPRITADMTMPPPSRPVSRAYIETLFA